MALELELSNIYLWALVGLFWACDKTSFEIGRNIGHVEFQMAMDLLNQQQEEDNDDDNSNSK